MTLFFSTRPKMYRFNRTPITHVLALVCAHLLTTASGAVNAETLSNLSITVSNIKTTSGVVKVAIFDSEETYLKQPLYQIDKPAVEISGKTASFTFVELPDGLYAVSVTHDENNNGELDTNFIGLPIEQYAFSNNAHSTFGPPSFDNASFYFNRDKRSIEIKFSK